MAKPSFEIKITGEGTKEQIWHALMGAVRLIQDSTEAELKDFENEDPTLFVKIKSQD